jgi:hypothetical protein
MRRDKAGGCFLHRKKFQSERGQRHRILRRHHGRDRGGLVLRDEQIQKYLDTSFARGEIPKRLTVGEVFDFSLLRNLK